MKLLSDNLLIMGTKKHRNINEYTSIYSRSNFEY